MKRFRLAVMAVIGSMALIGLYRCSYHPLQCSREAFRAERDLLFAINRDQMFGPAITARRSIERLMPCATRPLDANRSALIALGYRLLQQHEDSIDWYERALAIDRRPELYLGLGTEQLRAGNREAGIQNLVRACTFAPPLLQEIDDGTARKEVQRRITAERGTGWLGE